MNSSNAPNAADNVDQLVEMDEEALYACSSQIDHGQISDRHPNVTRAENNDIAEDEHRLGGFIRARSETQLGCL